MAHDFFICHASEDKDAVARPLAEELQRRGFSVWYDEFELGVGDSLREAIEYGLAESRFGVVVLSESFFEKKWTQHELDGLTAREMIGDERVLLPVWHEIDENFLVEVAPTLADRVAVPSSGGIGHVADKLVQTLERRRNSGGGSRPRAAAGASAIPTVASPAAEAPPIETPAAVDLVEKRERVCLDYTEDQKRRFAVEGSDPRGPGWLSVIVAPVELRQDLIDPTTVQISDLRALDLSGARDTSILQHYDLHPTLDGFEAQLPPGDENLPARRVSIAEDGLMEFGTTLVRALSSGDPGRDRTIPTHSVAEYINDWALLFLGILEHVGYTGEASVQAVFGGVEGHHLGVEQMRYFPNLHPLKVLEVPSRPLRGLVGELPAELPRWLKKTMDRLFLAGGITTGAYFLDDEGHFK